MAITLARESLLFVFRTLLCLNNRPHVDFSKLFYMIYYLPISGLMQFQYGFCHPSLSSYYSPLVLQDPVSSLTRAPNSPTNRLLHQVYSCL